MPTINYIWDAEIDSYLMETDEPNVTQAIYTNEPVQYGSLICQRSSSTTNFMHLDALGSVRHLTDSAEDITDAFMYDAWGNEVSRAGTIPLEFRWIGQFGYLHDPDTGQYDVRYRTFDPSTARWTARDPIAYILDDVLAASVGVNHYEYVLNTPATAIDPSGLKLFRANMVAKSFINGVPRIGSITPPLRAGLPIPPYWLVVPAAALILTATQRLNVLAGLVGGLPAFNQNPTTDAKDQTYRLYTRLDVDFDCDCSDNITITAMRNDKDGGLESPFMPVVYGTINFEGTYARLSNDCYDFVWTGWGRPHRIVELGMQWVAFRTSVNIWHEPRVKLCCEGGEGVFSVTSFPVSRFPSHKLWINSALQRFVPQQAFGDLWNPLPGTPEFVDD